MSGRQDAARLRLDIAVDRRRQVVSLHFTPEAVADSPGAGPAPPSPLLAASQLVPVEPNLVIKLTDEGRLIGIDIFNAAGTFGLEQLEDIALTMRVGG